MWGAVQAGLCCLRDFTGDRGRTVVERGFDRIRGGFAKQQSVRFLATFAGVSACFFFVYNVPAQWFGMHADPWPTDVGKRSYFNGGFCGGGSDKPCPNPVRPLPTKSSGYVDNDAALCCRRERSCRELCRSNSDIEDTAGAYLSAGLSAFFTAPVLRWRDERCCAAVGVHMVPLVG